MINIKSITYKEKYYAISYKLKFILKSNLSISHKFKCQSVIPDKQAEDLYLDQNGMLYMKSKFLFKKFKYIAICKFSKEVMYFEYNKLHRDNKPAIINYYKNRIRNVQYYKNDRLHREDNKPALIEYENEVISLFEYYVNGTRNYLL